MKNTTTEWLLPNMGGLLGMIGTQYEDEVDQF